MPVVAIGAGIYGAASLAAGGLTVLETIAAVGSIVSAVGVVTGNKDLAMIGGVAGLAGGIGAFAQSQGWLASGNAASAMGDTGSNIEAMMNTPTPGMNPTDARLAAGTQATPMEGGGGLMDAEAPTGGVLNDALTQTNNLATNPTDMRLADGTQGTPPGANTSPAAQAMGAGPNGGTNPTDLRLAAGTQTTPMGSSSSVLDTIRAFLSDKDNKSLLGNFIGGMFDSEKAAKTGYYEALTEQLRRQAANASAVPKLGLHLKQTGPVFPSTAPTYHAPAVSGGLFAH